MPKQWGPF